MTDKPRNDIGAVLGHPDDLKFRSSMTLFAAVTEAFIAVSRLPATSLDYYPQTNVVPSGSIH
jgi:uncharacterized protein (DUF1810 family)